MFPSSGKDFHGQLCGMSLHNECRRFCPGNNCVGFDIVLALMHLVPAPKALHETLDKNSFRSELEVVNRQRSAVVVQYLIICTKGSMRRFEILL